MTAGCRLPRGGEGHTCRVFTSAEEVREMWPRCVLVAPMTSVPLLLPRDSVMELARSRARA